MRLPTPQRICRNKGQGLFNDYFKFASLKSDWFKWSPAYKQVFLYDKSRKGQVSGYKLVEVSSGCLDTTVFVYITPLRFPVRFHRHLNSSYNDLKYKSYMILLGLTAGLISLGSLWLYDFFEISADSSKSLDENRTNFGIQFNPIDKYNSNNTDLVKIYPTFISNQILKLNIGFSANPESTDEKPKSRSIQNQFTSEQIISSKNEKCEVTNSAENLIVSEEIKSNSVSKCTTKPYFNLIGSSLNCAHFLSDTGQICLLCWLNMPDYWLYNPSWLNTFKSVYENSLKSNTHLLGFIICVQLIYKTLYFIYEKTIKQLFQQKNDINHNTTTTTNYNNNQQIKVESIESIPIHKHIRLAGDGAPSIHTPIQFQLAEKEQYRNSFNKPRYSFDTLEYDTQTNLFKTHSVQSVFQNDLLLNSDRNINTNDISTTSSAIHFGNNNNNNDNMKMINNSPNNTGHVHNNSNRNECCDSTTNRLLSKILKVLSIKQIDNSASTNKFPIRYLYSDPNLLRQFDQTDEIAQRLTNSQPNSTTHNYQLLNHNDYPRKNKRFHLLRSFRRSGSNSPCLSVDSDGFEYDDELITCFDYEKLNENKNSTEQFQKEIDSIDNTDADDETDEDEINLTHLFDTFNSLINTQSDLNQSSVEIEEKNPDCDGNNKSRFESKGFSDLTEKANKLTNELNNLEITLDRLLYKLQANQIQLDQAESNLDYVWHLRDNLDNSSSDDESYLPNSSDVDNDFNMNAEQKSSIEVYSEFHRSSEQNDLIHLTDHDSFSNNEINNHIIENNENQLIKSNDSFSQEIHYSTMFDSGFDQSLICPNQDLSSMTKSMPEFQLSYNQSSSSLSKSFSPKNSRHCPYSRSLRSHKRFNSRTDDKRRSNLGNYRFSTEVHPDADGFLHPDLTFDKDGIFDWTEPMCISTE